MDTSIIRSRERAMALLCDQIAVARCPAFGRPTNERAPSRDVLYS
jgi:hypothetical protein